MLHIIAHPSKYTLTRLLKLYAVISETHIKKHSENSFVIFFKF